MGLYSLTFLATIETEYLPMFDLVLQTFLQMLPHLVSFGVLVFFFAKFLYKPVKEVLQKRADRIESDIADATASKTTAEELKTLYEQKIRDIEIERNTILDDARKEAAARLDQILSEAKIEAAGIKERANRDINTERERIKGEVHQAIIDISTDMAAKLVSATIDKHKHDELFAQAMQELEATAFSAR